MAGPGPNDWLLFNALKSYGRGPGLKQGAPGDVLDPDFYTPQTKDHATTLQGMEDRILKQELDEGLDSRQNKRRMQHGLYDMDKYLVSSPQRDVSIPQADLQGSDTNQKGKLGVGPLDALVDMFMSLNGPQEKKSPELGAPNRADKGPFGGDTGRTFAVDESPPNSVMKKGIAADTDYGMYPRELHSGTPPPALEYAHAGTGQNATPGEVQSFAHGIGLGAILHSIHSSQPKEEASQSEQINREGKSGKATNYTVKEKTSVSSGSKVIRKEKPAKKEDTPDMAARMRGLDTD